MIDWALRIPLSTSRRLTCPTTRPRSSTTGSDAKRRPWAAQAGSPGSRAPTNEVITDRAWLEGDFFTTVQKRGAAIIEARGLSSAASAANGLIDHVRDLRDATPANEWRSVCVKSDGSYGVTEGLISSFPVRADGNGGWEIVQGLELDAFLQDRITKTVAELEDERETVKDLLS